MKRHESLIPLSREHHGALILARLLQADAPLYKGLPAHLAGKAQYAVKFYADELAEHFLLEEKMLTIVKDISPKLDNMLEEMAEEHVILRELFRGINTADDLATYLDSLGKALEKHVRKEEREIFPLVQESCGPAILDQLTVLLLKE